MQPKISVVIPMYNAQKTIEQSLNSIYNQDFKNFEVIIVDDGSTDNSIEIVKKFPAKLIHQKNAGPSKARNTGIKNSESDLILLIDADVVMSPGTLAKVFKAFQDKNVNILSGLQDEKNHYNNTLSDYENLYIHYIWKLQKSTTPSFFTTFVAIRKSILTKFSGFDERIRMAEDMELGLRLLRANYKIH